MALFKFASIGFPEKYGYAFDTSAWGRSTETHYYYRQFETGGDGLTQHSNDWSVTFEYLADFLASLAVAMLGNDELTEAASYSLNYGPRIEKIEFAASIVFKESDKSYSKRRYYSMELLKVGSSTKEYDKRFKQVSEFEDGSEAAIFRMVCPDYADGFERWQIAKAIEQWADKQKKSVSVGSGFPLFLGGDHNKNYGLGCALGSCRNIAEALTLRQRAESGISNYKHYLERERAKAAEAAEAAEASDAA